jgi:hypothetical protein
MALVICFSRLITLPIFGVGHSFGALAQLLIGGHYTSLPDLSGFGSDFLII